MSVRLCAIPDVLPSPVGTVCAFCAVQLENWVFESDKPDAELKLIDFGLSTYFGKVRRRLLLFGFIGQCHGTATEMQLRDKYQMSFLFTIATAVAVS